MACGAALLREPCETMRCTQGLLPKVTCTRVMEEEKGLQKRVHSRQRVLMSEKGFTDFPPLSEHPSQANGC